MGVTAGVRRADCVVVRNCREWTRNGQENYSWKIPVYYWALLTKT